MKSLVFVAPTDDQGLEAILCLVSGVNRVDLSRLAAVTGEKDVRRATAREANELTGFTIGGIPPIGHLRPVRVIMDPDLGRYPVVWAAAGTADRGLPGAAGHPPDAGQRHRRPDRRGPRAGPGSAAWSRAPPRRDDRRAATRRRRLPGRDPDPVHLGAAAARGLPSSPSPRPAARWSTTARAISDAFERMCRAEMRVDTPAGPWTARLASPLFDDPAALLWDAEGLLVAKYGFVTYGFAARERRPRAGPIGPGSPVLTALGSSRLPHVLVQAEVETFAIRPDGEVAWRVAHSDVVTAAELVGGRLVLTSYAGQLTALDPRTGRPAGA